MSGANLPLHGRNHRPGGEDPIPALAFIGTTWVPFITAGQGIHGSSSTSGTAIVVDFSDEAHGFVTTNDNGSAVSTPVTSPYSGNYYSFDWSSNSNQINLLRRGVYWVRGAYWVPVTEMNGDPDMFQITATITGGSGGELGGINTPRTATSTFLGGANVAAASTQNYVAHYGGLHYVSSTSTIGLTVEHTAGSIVAETSATFAELQAAYLGDLFNPVG